VITKKKLKNVIRFMREDNELERSDTGLK